MKKIYSLSMLAIVAMAAFSCAKVNEENKEPEKVFEPKVISAFTDADVKADTKTSLSGVSILWATTDNIKGWDGSTVHTSTATAVSEGDKKAEFTFSTVSVESDLFTIAYPAEKVTNIDDDFVYATIPSTQTATANSFANQANVAVADGLTANPIFKNVGGLLSIIINNDNITSIKLSANENLTGESKISTDPSSYAVATILEGKKNVTLSGTIASGSEYYAVVYPGTYTGLKIEVTNTSGQVATYSNPNPLTVERNGNLHIATLTIPDGKWVTPTKGSTYTWNAVLGDFGSSGSPLSSISAGSPSLTWTPTYTWGGGSASKYLGTDGSGRGVQIGAGSADNKCAELELVTTGYTGYVKDIRLNVTGASADALTATVSVGETALKYNGNTSVTISTNAADTYLFSSNDLVKGDIVITLSNTANKALYVKSIEINPDLRTPQTLSFPQAAYSVELTDGTFDNPGVSGANTSVSYSTDDPDEDVVTIDPATGDLTLNGTGTVHITAVAAADATYQEGSASYTLTVTNGPSAISAVIAAANDASVYTSGVVAEVNAKGFIITDGNDNLQIYQNATPSAVEGQFVKVSGTRGSYNNVPQIKNSPAPVITYGLTGQSITRTSLTTITSSNCTGFTTSEYVQLAGNLTQVSSNYNVSITGTDAVTGRLYQPVTTKSYGGVTIPEMVGGAVNVTGYVTGNSASLLYVAPVDIKFVKHGTPDAAGYAENSTTTITVASNCTWTAAKGTDNDNIIKSVTYNSSSITVTFNANAGDVKSAQVIITPAAESGIPAMSVAVNQVASGDSVIPSPDTYTMTSSDASEKHAEYTGAAGTLVLDKGSNNSNGPVWNVTDKTIRMYKNNTITVTATSAKIASIAMTVKVSASSGNNPSIGISRGGGTISPASCDTSTTSITWTAGATDVDEVVLTLSNENGNIGFKSIVVTYK